MIYTPDAADIFISQKTGVPISKICRAEVDIKKRVGGSSFPLRFAAADDLFIQLDYISGAIFAADPLDILIARESADYALDSDEAADYLVLADIQEIDTLQIAKQEKITRRRAQQIKREKIAAAECGQREFDFCGGAS